MKIYTFYTSQNERLLREWFLPTLKDDYSVIAEKGDQGEASGIYREKGWSFLMGQKAGLIIRAIQENWSELFIYSDPDVQFFDTINPRLTKIYKNQDLIFQRNSPRRDICAGFFLCRGNDRTLSFWQDIKDLIGHDNMDDQDAGNYLLTVQDKVTAKFICKFLSRTQLNEWYKQPSKSGKNDYGIKWGLFPNEFYCGGTLTGKRWVPGLDLIIPKGIVLHHANFTDGMENKIAQLKYVRDIYEKACPEDH